MSINFNFGKYWTTFTAKNVSSKTVKNRRIDEVNGDDLLGLHGDHGLRWKAKSENIGYEELVCQFLLKSEHF